jgi:hypothetical protein
MRQRGTIKTIRVKIRTGIHWQGIQDRGGILLSCKAKSPRNAGCTSRFFHASGVKRPAWTPFNACGYGFSILASGSRPANRAGIAGEISKIYIYMPLF